MYISMKIGDLWKDQTSCKQVLFCTIVSENDDACLPLASSNAPLECFALALMLLQLQKGYAT